MLVIVPFCVVVLQNILQVGIPVYHLMREECRSFQNPISVFNPRGQDFQE